MSAERSPDLGPLYPYECGNGVSSLWSGQHNGFTATPLGDGRVVAIGGLKADACGSAHALGTAEIYDPTGNSWSAQTTMFTPRYDHTATFIPNGSKGLILVAGGSQGDGLREGDATAATEVFDPEGTGGGSWTPAGDLLMGREHHTATLLNDDSCPADCGPILVAGGYARNDRFVYLTPADSLTSSELYDPVTRRWSLTAPMDQCLPPLATCGGHARHHAVRLNDGTVLVSGGGAVDERYAIRRSQQVAPVPASASPQLGTSGSEVTIRGEGLFPATSVLFGPGHAAPIRFNSEFELVTVSPPQPRGTAVDITVRTPAGASGVLPGVNFTYDGVGHWEPTASLSEGRYDHTATLLDPSACHDGSAAAGYPCGKVLVAGGTNGFVVGSATGVVTRDRAQLYDPAAMPKPVWTDTASMSECSPSPSCASRAMHTATLLDGPACRIAPPRPAYCGRVLVAGGRLGNSNKATGAAELYDPTSNKGAGSWTPAPNLRDARVSHTATLLDPPRAMTTPRLWVTHAAWCW